MPAPEAKLWNALRQIRPLGFHFRRQVPLGPYYADFACHARRLVVEVDGDTHGSDDAIRYDEQRDTFIASHGYRILRVTNHEVMRNLDGVMTAILNALDTPTLTPSPQGGGKPARRKRDAAMDNDASSQRLPPPCGEGSRVGVGLTPISRRGQEDKQ